MPTMMLTRKERVGGKVYREYDIDTPNHSGFASAGCVRRKGDKNLEFIWIRFYFDLRRSQTYILLQNLLN